MALAGSGVRPSPRSDIVRAPARSTFEPPPRAMPSTRRYPHTERPAPHRCNISQTSDITAGPSPNEESTRSMCQAPASPIGADSARMEVPIRLVPPVCLAGSVQSLSRRDLPEQQSHLVSGASPTITNRTHVVRLWFHPSPQFRKVKICSRSPPATSHHFDAIFDCSSLVRLQVDGQVMGYRRRQRGPANQQAHTGRPSAQEHRLLPG